MGLPITLAVVLLFAKKLATGEVEYFPAILPAVIAFTASAVVGLITAKFLLKFFQNHSLRGFAYYLIILGGAVIIL